MTTLLTKLDDPIDVTRVPDLVVGQVLLRDGGVTEPAWFLIHKGQYYRLSHVLSQPSVPDASLHLNRSLNTHMPLKPLWRVVWEVAKRETLQAVRGYFEPIKYPWVWVVAMLLAMLLSLLR